jgi:biopolymer transport protein ExbB
MAWFNTSYLNKKKLTLDHTKVSGSSDLSSFPVLVSATDVNLKVTGSGGQVQNSSGFDIIFVDSTETTQLDHEIEKYVSTTGEIEMWVRIPTLSHTADTVIYMYFNNSGISTSQENKTGVWDSNYNAVWHLKETSGNQNDSTSNANNITGFTGVTRGSATGKANGADGFTAGQVSEATAPNASTLLPTGDMTLEMWVNISTLATSAIGRFILKDADNYAYQVYQNISSARFSFDWANTSFTVYTVSSNTSPSTATWYYLSCVHDSTNNKIHIYVNGANDDSSTVTTTGTLYVTNPASFALGSSVSGKSPAATIDEVRLSKTIRTDGWLATTYNAVNSPSTFYSTGAMESQRVIPSTAALLQTSTRTITSTAALLQTNTRTITSTAALLQTSTRTITSTASLDSGATTSTRTITSTAALLANEHAYDYIHCCSTPDQYTYHNV